MVKPTRDSEALQKDLSKLGEQAAIWQMQFPLCRLHDQSQSFAVVQIAMQSFSTVPLVMQQFWQVNGYALIVLLMAKEVFYHPTLFCQQHNSEQDSG